MAASDARGPRFAEDPGDLPPVEQSQAPTRPYRHRTSEPQTSAVIREASDWPLRPRRPPHRAALFIYLLPSLPWVLHPVFSVLCSAFGACRPVVLAAQWCLPPSVLQSCYPVCHFCTCNEAAQQVCLNLPIERLMPSRGPAHKIQDGSIRSQTESSPYFE
jgi:hypothetical protein